MNLPSSIDLGNAFYFQSLGIRGKDDIMANESKLIGLLDENSIMVRVNFQPPGLSWVLIRFEIRKNTSFNELIGILNKELDPVPQNMTIYYEDAFGDFGRLANEAQMNICLRICRRQKFVNLVII
ncbi:hypothetical protein ACJIZ3_007907 [Penstemon smallii]|uniref:PB1 domain-containing protein n=1 Tax=Penstemon smallii TaxID=265156 RepID=A0ABD3T970_9LAMI